MLIQFLFDNSLTLFNGLDIKTIIYSFDFQKKKKKEKGRNGMILKGKHWSPITDNFTGRDGIPPVQKSIPHNHVLGRYLHLGATENV
jgi:hypothetical protein